MAQKLISPALVLPGELFLKEAYTRSFLKWAGGKFELLPVINRLLPSGAVLVEPFAGSAVVFLNSSYERYWLNDINRDLINTYQMLKQYGGQFVSDAEKFFSPAFNDSEKYYKLRDEFNSLDAGYRKGLLFLYLNRHAYNGLCRYNRAGNFNVPFGRNGKVYFPREELEWFLAKVGRATFLCEPYTKTFSRVRSGCGHVVYCDPPYVPLSETAKFSDYSPLGFSAEDQERLAEVARRTAKKGVPVLISNHDTEESRRLYKGARIVSVNVSRRISRDASTRAPVKELLALFV